MLSINDRKRKSSMSLSKDASASTKLRHNHLGGQDSQSMSTESPHSSNEGRQPSLMGFDLIQEQLLELEWRREEDRDELWSVVRSLNDQIKELRENRVVDERTKNVLESSSSVSSLTSLRRQAASDHILVKREEDGSPDSDIYNATPRPITRSRPQTSTQRTPTLAAWAHYKPTEALETRDSSLVEFLGPHIRNRSIAVRSLDVENPREENPDGFPQDCPFQRDLSLPPVTNQTIMLYDGMRMPAVIERLPRMRLLLPEDPNEEFTSNFLKRTFGGSSFGNGFYQASAKVSQSGHFPGLHTYMITNGDHEPLLPRYPGQYGAQTSCLMLHRDQETATFPVFIRRGEGGYRYYGSYREPCWSDFMASDELSRGVPDHVKHHKAALICSKTTRAIATIKDAWPKRPIGWWDERCRKMIDYDLELVDDYGEPLKLPITDEEAEAVSRRDILKAFDQPDCTDEIPSIRLYYEYLECVGYDSAFYHKLVAQKKKKLVT